MALHLTVEGRRILGSGADRVQATLDRLEDALPQPSDEEADFEDFLALGALWYYVLSDLLLQKDDRDLSELHREAQLLSGLLTSDSEM
jgi:hypothetical protein